MYAIPQPPKRRHLLFHHLLQFTSAHLSSPIPSPRMAYFSATQLHTLSWTSSFNPNFTYRTLKLLFYPKPVRASFSSSNVETKDSSTTTLWELCIVPWEKEVGYVIPTEVQLQALSFLFSGHDCVLHAQTGSGKTLAYRLQVLSVVDSQRSAVQALIVVPTRELGMQVTKVARVLAANPSECESELKSCTIVALLDGGMLKRHELVKGASRRRRLFIVATDIAARGIDIPKDAVNFLQRVGRTGRKPFSDK